MTTPLARTYAELREVADASPEVAPYACALLDALDHLRVRPHDEVEGVIGRICDEVLAAQSRCRPGHCCWGIVCDVCDGFIFEVRHLCEAMVCAECVPRREAQLRRHLEDAAARAEDGLAEVYEDQLARLQEEAAAL